MIDVVISAVQPDEIGEVLTLQRAAYVTEAQLYADPFLPPLTQTYAELERELESSLVLKATLGQRIVGAVRGRIEQSVLRVGRLVVAPDLQGHGIGSRLLAAVEHAAAGAVDRHALFTGQRSAANLRLYQRHGYTEVRREELRPGLTIVHLEKPAEGS